MHLISPKVHGVIDYLAVALLVFAPAIFGFIGVPAYLCYAFAGWLLGLSLLTAYPLGVVQVIPFTAHAAVEIGSTILFIVAPWIFGFADVAVARTFFLSTGVLLGVVYLSTNYRGIVEVESDEPPRPIRKAT